MRILAVGYCTLDQIGLVEEFGEGDSHAEMPTISIQGGGTAATAAVALSRWGASTRFVGKVADDERGDLIVRTLSNEGVDTSSMVREKGKVSQLSFVIVKASSGQRHCYYTSGNVGQLQPEEIDPNIVEGHDLLLIDAEYPAAQAHVMKRARELGIPVVLEADRHRGVVAECVALADVVIASEREASAFTGVGNLEGICRAFLEKGPKIAIVTLGDEGAVALGREESLVRVPADDVNVVDRTGAGDIFLASVALGVVEGWPLEKLVRFANRAASLACTGLGGRGAIADREEIEAFISK